MLGHDLRNPLAAINMGIGLLRRDPAGPLAKRTLDRIASSTRRMTRMVEQILDLSRARLGGGIAVDPAPMDLRAMLTAVTDEVRAAHPDRVLDVQCPAISGIWDRDRLEQVFSNLVSNAIHHGLASSPVRIVASQDADRVHIDVHNEGPAIPDAVREVLFEAFRRGDSETTKPSGLGLGLFISRELIAAHGGEIAVRSTADQGTTFRVTLPGPRSLP